MSQKKKEDLKIGHYDEIKALNEKIINALKNKKVIELIGYLTNTGHKKKLSDKISDKKLINFIIIS